jgi:hypothetical protein
MEVGNEGEGEGKGGRNGGAGVLKGGSAEGPGEVAKLEAHTRPKAPGKQTQSAMVKWNSSYPVPVTPQNDQDSKAVVRKR